MRRDVAIRVVDEWPRRATSFGDKPAVDFSRNAPYARQTPESRRSRCIPLAQHPPDLACCGRFEQLPAPKHHSEAIPSLLCICHPRSRRKANMRCLMDPSYGSSKQRKTHACSPPNAACFVSRRNSPSPAGKVSSNRSQLFSGRNAYLANAQSMYLPSWQLFARVRGAA